MENKKSFFPLFIDLTDKNCLVVGGGNIALRKVKNLVEYGAKVLVIAPAVLPEILELNVKVEKRGFEIEDINGKFLVVAATDNESLNKTIVDVCEDKNILVNNITSKTYMSARFTAHIDDENYQIAISAKGKPKESVKLKKDIIEYLKNKKD
ncbi:MULTISPECIES: precorrin-2 dehydrogenase/sirohydrochlorin ferrochelatase family protein [Cetobacterium]|jgi:precorrin-2 dehydrogenase/sirohydrochlorin ferrochelatase|uniref:precorrin-2 dehydrogenase n=1 Tax=Candidatus Cetobacterium colombiensis TaxID=3073100 RepID=A0ABU4WCI3_9FUSO|nr:bifunctional precorrin-2 dehydrogenase/sirohydrochlorin ferrochelatase [Candidatus Cetobacterium colombiensis]MDX8336414.1 bifunctional precorrin-2 dehydrogenase/sirohydrochlorin ferrochelatase [Candidatus Cetobacterium colombiensis]